MAKDYSKIKALAASIIECIGDDEEGENPKIPGPKEKPDPEPNEFGENGPGKGGQSPSLDFLGKEEDGNVDPEGAKKKKASSLAMYGSMLASKFGK